MDRKKNRTELSPDPEDRKLWEEVKSTAVPLERARSGKVPRREPQRPGERPRGPSRRELVRDSARGDGARIPAPIEGIERRTARRLARGTIGIDRTIDLHGMSREEAYGALVEHLGLARQCGERWVLVITGKGRSRADGDRDQPAGVLRGLLPQWLRDEDLAPVVVAFGAAGRRHGGGGAFYVQLRRKK